ncbi:hypothetical protein TRFO_03542 [Tritrichomonas foetus]|uniref:Uncharacterized protein n=1 Tax=Tritrichomonas foetus TaxID=1144522 RepID=A0A1J4KRV3_9EUKA|nr:hypothetical protein [Tritrichomonas foetus]OHT12548.1 hypothetical protein TRFO_03542 [Tritrichomonas foetus]|eukprot:OHT12548.1 hypothetical protein TRFO_03542 [Tritrichomonas foetus]
MSQGFKSTFSASVNSGSTIKSFDEYQATRREKMEQVSNDLQAKKEQDIQNLQDTLNDLMMQLSVAHSNLAADERHFLAQKETLESELKKIKITADTQFSINRDEYRDQMTKLQKEYDRTMSEYVRNMPDLMNPSKPADIAEPYHSSIGSTSTRRSPYKSPKQSSKSIVTIDEIDDDSSDHLYTERIQQLESQKQELIQLIKEDERNNQNRITEITTMMDVQDSQFDKEIAKLQEKMKQKEEAYKTQLNSLYVELQRAKDKRKATTEKRQEKVSSLQAQIDRVENEYKEKIREANSVAEKLKTSLLNANIRKSQQLELERRRTEESRMLNEESLSLQQQVFEMQKDLQRAKEESQLRRRELSAQLGPRRTASLFP